MENRDSVLAAENRKRLSSYRSRKMHIFAAEKQKETPYSTPYRLISTRYVHLDGVSGETIAHLPGHPAQSWEVIGESQRE